MTPITKKWMAVFLCIAGAVNLTGCYKLEKSTGQVKDTIIIAEKNVGAGNTSEYTRDQETASNKEIDINLNQVGYRPTDKKLAVIRNNAGKREFQVLDEEGNIAYTGALTGGSTDNYYCETLYYADFSELTEEGTYYIMCGDTVASPFFEIHDDIYNDIKTLAVAPFALELQYASNTSQEKMDEMLQEQSSLEKRSKDAKIYLTGESVDVSGGWYSQGDSGRYIVTSCTALMDLMYVKQYYKKSIEKLSLKYSETSIDLDETIKEELTWMLKMQEEQTGGVYHKVTTAKDNSLEVSAEDGTLYVSGVSSCATADFAAVMAKGYQLYKDKDREFAKDCLAASKKAWTFLEDNSETIQFINPEDINTKEYSDDVDQDERLWAATELYLATKEDVYFEYMKYGVEKISSVDFGWRNVSGFAYFDYVCTSSENNEVHQQMETALQNEKDCIISGIDQGYQINQEFSRETTEYLLNRIVLLALMDKESGENEYTSERKNYMNYIMGQNPESRNYLESLTKDQEELALELSSALLLVLSSI